MSPIWRPYYAVGSTSRRWELSLQVRTAILDWFLYSRGIYSIVSYRIESALHFMYDIGDDRDDSGRGERGRGRGGRGSRGRGRGGTNGDGGRGGGGGGWEDGEGEGGEPEVEKKPPVTYVPPEPTENEEEIFANTISTGINFDKFDHIAVKVSIEILILLPSVVFLGFPLLEFIFGQTDTATIDRGLTESTLHFYLKKKPFCLVYLMNAC